MAELPILMVAPLWFRNVSWTLAALYVVSAALQYNDPDPLRWIAIYLAAAVAAFFLPLRRWAIPLSFAVSSAALLWAVVLFPDIWGKVGLSDMWLKMSEKGGAVEVEREIGGLVIVVGWLVLGASLRRRQLRAA